MRGGLVAAGLIAVIAGQAVLYIGFVEREVVWSYVFRGDPTWYVSFCYQVLEDMLRGDWRAIGQFARNNPWGLPLFLEAGLIQMVIGHGRLGVVSVNLVYAIGAQLATFLFFRRVAGTAAGGWLALLLLLAMQTPFRGDGPGLNIADFHFDLILFYLLLCILYLVGRSDSFASRPWSIAVAVLAAVTVATRLVSIFLLVGILGPVFLWLLWRLWRDVADRSLARLRVVNMLMAAGIFVVLAGIPLIVARKAIYAHYFRFVFDPKFIADKQGLYTMASSKLEDAWQLIYRMVVYDFAGPFALAAALLVALAILGRTSWRPMAGTRESRGTFIAILAIATIFSYLLHLVFPIKSDHLTRMTAAPIFVLIAFVTVGPASAGLRAIARPAGVLGTAFAAGLAVVAAYVQLSFYTGKGPFADRRPELEKVLDLYGDISRIVHARDMKAIALSVDSVIDFEQGAMLSYVSYEYERNGRLLKPAAKLGDKVDEPIGKDDALAEISQSDFVLLQAGEYRSSSFWPMMRSVASYHGDLVAHVRRNFCLVSTYTIEGRTKELYVRPQAWRVTASGRQNKRSGPEGMLGANHVAWTAPWHAGGEQWLEFETDVPVTIETLAMQVPKKQLAEAPRDFRLEALDDGGRRILLEAGGVSFAVSERQSWSVPSAAPARRYRLTFTANNGDPARLSIRRLWVTLDHPPCEFGRPYE